jgi:predicted porin
MKKILIATAVAASFASAAHAQSSVTLYGALDAALTYTSNVAGGSKYSLGSSNDENRFGLRGTEDLGGGLKTVFTLEQGFNLNDGSQGNASRMFSRQAFVGLSSQFGTVTLGRQYDAMQDYLAPLTATGSFGGANFAHYGNFDHLDENSQDAASNSIKFKSANYSGVSFGGTYSFSNNTNFANNRAYSFGAAYENAGLRVGAGYAQQNNAGATPNGAYDTGIALLIDGDVASVRTRQFGVGASYAFGPAVVGGAWTQARLDNVTGLSGSIHTNNFEVNGKYNVTAAMTLGAAYTYSNGAAASEGFHVNQFGLHSDYALSKRTDVYLQGVYQIASSANNVVPGMIDNGNVTGASSSRRQHIESVGLRHRF